MPRTIENSKEALESLEKPVESLEPPFLTCSTPTRQELELLKGRLGITDGSFRYRSSGDKVYHAVYDSEKKKVEWRQVGVWMYLKNLVSKPVSRK